MSEKNKIINLGCGLEYREGMINCDISREVTADKHFDVEEGMPFETDYADIIYAHCILEQVSKFLFVVNELWRVCKSGGFIEIEVPLAPYKNAFQDPMDIRHFTEETFTYLDVNHRRYDQYGKNYGFRPFQVKRQSTDIRENWGRMSITLMPFK